MNSVIREPGSFRDPDNAVFYADGRVFRALSGAAAADWERFSGSPAFVELIDSGRIVKTAAVPADSLPPGSPASAALTLEHERIPFVSYPYEWTFEMLRDAAIVHLEILLATLADDITMKDGYSFNVQFVGSRPVFIDIGSFEALGGGPWIGYRQFCMTFLYPLLLEAHLGVPFQKFLRGHLNGLEPSEMRTFFPGRRRFRKGVFQHVYLHSVAEQRVNKGGRKIQEDLGKAGFSKELTVASARKLLKLVRSLNSKRGDSGWKAYRDTCSYSDADSNTKSEFIESVVKGANYAQVWDLGANDGAFSRIAAEHAQYVLAVDSDDVTVDVLYRALREDSIDNVLPMVMDLVDPSPARGWRGQERKAFTDRGQPDLVLALALVHHLAIAANVPLPEVVGWFASLGGAVVIEFVEPHDPMAKRLLENKPAGMFPDYRRDVFEELLAGRFEVVRSQQLPGESRTLYFAKPLESAAPAG